MFCNYCGKPNPEDASFCRSCGKPVTQITAQSDQAALDPAPKISNSPAASPTVSGAPEQNVSSAGQNQSSSVPQKRGNGLWVFTGILVLIVIAGAAASGIFRGGPNDSHESYQSPSTRESPAPAPAPAPAQPEATPAPTPEQPSPPPAPAAAPTIVGEWVTQLNFGGSSTLILTGDGRYQVKNFLVNDSGIYTYSKSDGSLRLQEDGILDHSITTWNAQLSPDGDSLSVIEPEGASHIYKRVE